MNESTRVESIFLAAREKPEGAERAEYLESACGGDTALYGRVQELLRLNDQSQGPLDGPPPGMATWSLNTVGEEPGDQIGPYKIREQIGEGGFGVVYVAVQEKPVRRKVALKIIKPGMDTKDVIARFEAEQQALALMDHPNVAKVLDAGTTESGRPYFVMELVHGVKITEFCDKNRLSMQDRLKLFIDVCHAVQHAHHKGIIHRDLKPNNILVTLHDGKPVPKVIDFGVAKALSQQLTEKTIYTAYGQMIGTPEYMSPEQAEMSGLGIDTRSDVYSLGVLLYELLVGQPPFEAKRLRASGFEGILRIIREEEPPKPSTKVSTMGEKATVIADHRRTDAAKLRQSLQGELDWIVMKALDKDRNRRYETANGFANDIERYLHDDPVQACPPSTAYKVRKFARRNKGPVAAAAALLAVLLLGLAGTTIGLVRERAAAEEAREARTEADEDRKTAVNALESMDLAQRAERLTNFRMAFDRGIALCEEGHVGSGLLWMAHALSIAPEDEEEMMRVIRANLNAWRRELHTLETVIPHEQAVTAVSYSPDGNLVLTGTVNGWVQLWDLRNGTPKTKRIKHDAQVHEVPFSPDGSHFLTASYDNTARLWNTSTGELVRTFQHDSTVYGALFLSDGRIVTSTAGGKILMWDPSQGEDSIESWELADHAIHDISLGPDEKQIVAAWHDGGVVVWDLEAEQYVARFTEHYARVATADFLGSNKIVSGDTDGNVYLWEWTDVEGAAMGKRIGKPYRHQGCVHRLRVSDDGNLLLTASFDNRAQFLDALTGEPVGVPIGHQGALQALALSRRVDGRHRAFTACGDDFARQWLRAPGSREKQVAHERGSQPAIFTNDAEYVVIKKTDGTATIYRALTRQQVGAPFQHSSGGIASLAVSPDESRVMTGSSKGVVQMWKTESGEPFGESFSHGGTSAWTVIFSSDGQRAYSGGLDGIVQAWDVASGKPVGEPLVKLDGFSVRGMALSPDDARIAVATSAATLVVDAMTGNRLHELLGHNDEVMRPAFSHDGRLLATGSFDNTALVYDLATGQAITNPMQHRGPIWYAVAFNSDATAIVTACDDRSARIWDVKTGKPIGPRLPHEATLRAATFANDDMRLITGTATGITRVWDVSSAPIEAEVEHIKVWLQASCGMELDADSGEVRAFDREAWQQRRDRLAELGGPPEA